MNKIIKKAAAIVTALAVVVTAAVFDIPEKTTAEAAVTPTVSLSLGTLKTYTQSGSDKDSIALSSLTSSSNWSKSLSGNTITLRESDKYKTYNVGYVPIIASVTVPANTSYRTTMHFNITGSPNKSSSSSTATAFVELFDLGTSNISSGITFRTPSKDDKNKEQFSDSRTLGRDIRETKDFTSSGSVPIIFENTSSTEKTISHYLGFFAGCRYGSKYTHQVEAKCALSFDKLVDCDTVAPIINYSNSDARYIIYHRSALSSVIKSFSKEQFYPDVPSSSLTRKDFDAMGGSVDPYDDRDLELYRYTWDQKFKLSSNTDKLVFAINKSGSESQGKLAYVPFTVPIKVPAHTERTYYLTFEISYNRGTGSGAGFFAELIEGGVPNSFNTAASASMTGNTKLRVYSDSGGKTKIFSGTVTLPLTLKNDTDSAKTMYGNYVYFVGYCHVGVYNPEPNFNLTLTDIGYASYEDDYYAEINASNCTYTHNRTITPGSDYNATITANTGYSLPSTITVKCGGTTMSTSLYTWNSSTGKLSIASKNITGGIVVTANGVPNTYSITYSGLDGASLTTKPTTHTYGTATSVGNPSKTGYTFAGWKINGGSTATKSLSLGATSYTANIALEATWTINKYNATLSGTNVSTSSGFGTNTVTYNTAWTGKFTANTGYDLPSSISVTVGGTSLASSKYTYSTSGSTGTVTIAASDVTGAVSVTAGGTAKKYSATLSGSHVSTSSGFGTSSVTYNTAWTGKFTANTGYTLPASVTVTVGGTTLTSGTHYTYSKSGSTGTVTITAANVTGAVVVTASPTANSYTITYNLDGGSIASTKPTKHTYGTATTVPDPTKTGYTFAGWKVNSGTTATKDLKLGATSYTADITLTATWTINTYNATLSSTSMNVTASTGFGTDKVTYKTAWTGYITAASGYVLPDTITVKVGSTTLTTSKYTYSKSTGKITITSTYVTGAVTVTAAGHKHSYTSTVTTAETCTTNGVRTYTCSGCGSSYTETITKTGHSYAAAWTTSAAQHWHVCTKCNTAGTKSSHTWNDGVVTIEPTIISTGEKKFTCTTCPATKTETLAMLEHDHHIDPDNWTGHDDDEHWHECTDGCGEKVDHEPHTLTEIEHKDPTCTEDGYTKYECEVCKNTITKEIEALGHDFGSEWEDDGTNHYHVCAVCNTKSGIEEHKWNSGSVDTLPDCTNTGVRVYECTVCGAEKSDDIAVDAEAHDWGDWVISSERTNTIIRVCKVNSDHIDTKEIPSLDNKDYWKLVDSTKPTCTADGADIYECVYGQVMVTIPKIEHSIVPDERVEPTCVSTGLTEGSHCDLCGEVFDEQQVIAAPGHDWDLDNGEITTPSNCTQKGSETFLCKRCDATYTQDIPANGHTNVTDSAVAATCTETGLTPGLHCTVCEEVILEQTVIQALGHDWNGGEVTKRPACTEEGVRTYTCTRCGETQTEDIPANGHKPVTDNAVSATCTERGKTEGSHCTVCGKILKVQENIPALGHSWDDGEVTTPPTETEEGVRTYTCTVCGTVKTESIAMLGHTHDWDPEWHNDDDTYHWHDCLNGCTEKKDEAAHTWNDGKVTKESTEESEGEKTFECTVCGGTKTETIPATGGSVTPENPDEGNIFKEVKPGANVPDTKLETPLDELVEAVLTPVEQEVTKDGVDIKIILTVEDATDKVSAADKTAVEKAIGGLTNYKPGQYLDVNLFKVINGVQNPVTETKAALTITFEVPAKLRSNARTYSVIRVHGGKTTVLNDLDSDPNTVTIKTDKFSTYALTYHEETAAAKPTTPSGSGSGGSGSSGSRPSSGNSGSSSRPSTSTDNTSNGSTSSDNTSSGSTSSDSTSSDYTSSDTTSNGSTSSDSTSSDTASSGSTFSDSTSSDTSSSGSTFSDSTSSDTASSGSTFSDSTSSDNTSSGSISGDNTSSGSTSGDSTSGSNDSGDGNSTSDESTHTPNDSSPSEGNGNPATGIAISFVPLAAVFAALPLTIKRRKK